MIRESSLHPHNLWLYLLYASLLKVRYFLIHNSPFWIEVKCNRIETQP